MNYNARYPAKTGPRKLSKRPNETPGLENTVPMDNHVYQQNVFNQYNMPLESPSYNNMHQMPSQYTPYPAGMQQGNTNLGFTPAAGIPGFAAADQLLANPLVANVAMQYGSAIYGSGKNMVGQEIEKYVPVTKLKYYFAVNTSYVLKKLCLLFFPFTHSDWSVKYDQNEPVQPRFEVNAPDLYIPTMAYVTYVLVAGIVLGTQNRFSPEVLGILASTALAWTAVEIIVELVTLYIINITTHLKTLDLLAFAGYKYVGIIFAVLLSLVLNKSCYYTGLVYMGLALAFFLVRALKWHVLSDVPTENYEISVATSSSGEKRKLYFLLFVVGIQPFLMWWLSAHLVNPPLLPATTEL